MKKTLQADPLRVDAAAAKLHAIPDANHERADNLLCQVQAISQLVIDSADKPQISNAAWAMFDMIEQARDLYGKY